MNRTLVVSSNIKSIGYDEEQKLLEVEFAATGAVYQYKGIGPKRHHDLMRAESIGGYFSRSIRPKVKGVRVDKQPVVETSVAGLKDGAVYLALLKTKKAMGKNYHNLSYHLWVSCGKPEKLAETKAAKVYRQCVELIVEASGIKTFGGLHVEQAIKLAKERRI